MKGWTSALLSIDEGLVFSGGPSDTSSFLFKMKHIFDNRILIFFLAALHWFAAADPLSAQESQIKRVTARTGPGPVLVSI